LGELRQRATPARQLLVDSIAAINRPFTAEELVDEFVNRQSLTGRATVYRTLDWLRISGWISRVQHDGEHATYTRTLPGHHHTVICTNCGTTLMLGGCDLETLLAPVLASSGFEVQGHVLELYGRCSRCQAANA
jgi:Fur family transcriptional regulator, ferric uptake regulator